MHEALVEAEKDYWRDPLAQIRDYYADKFHKGGALNYIALQDFDLGYMIIGRIQVIEYLAWGIWVMPENYKFKDKAEEHYFKWLSSQEFKELFSEKTY